MVQVLWNSKTPHVRVRDHELVELRLVDLGNTAVPRFLVREVHASWSASAQEIEWEGYRDQPCGTAQEAERFFERRRASIVDAGFPSTTVLA